MSSLTHKTHHDVGKWRQPALFNKDLNQKLSFMSLLVIILKSTSYSKKNNYRNQSSWNKQTFVDKVNMMENIRDKSRLLEADLQ